MNKIDWLILNELSDDFESMTQIYPLEQCSKTKRSAIIDRIELLLQKGLIKLANDIVFVKEMLLAEPEEYYDTDFWFGLTERGAEEWEKHAKKFGEFEVDWSDAWSESLNYHKQQGYILGVSKEICMKYLKANRKDIVDFDSLKVIPISSFQAKYYKILSGGVKIKFKLNKEKI